MFINFRDENTDAFTAFLLILYFSFSSLILSPIVMITFYIVFKRLRLKRKRLSDGNVVLLIKNK